MIGNLSDVIVVGSGTSAVHSVWSLVEAGFRVTMLDVGNEDAGYARLIPSRPFSEIRRTDRQQHRYFLGDDFEGIQLGPVGVGPQIVPPRQFVFRDVDKLTPIVSPGFTALETLALGGLGGVWGAVCFPFRDNELIKCALAPEEMHPHYSTIARRIGVAACTDDLQPVSGSLEAVLPPLEIDSNAEIILLRYRRQRKAFQRAGIFMGRPFMAVLTEPLNGRLAQPYHDMDFWSNTGGNVYRPDLTVRELQRYANFSYLRPYLCESFHEDHAGKVVVCVTSLEDSKKETFVTRRLILAAGALGTARIVLRSLNKYDVPVPIMCNTHTYVPCVLFPSLGKQQKDRCHSLAQVTMIYDPTGDCEHLVQAQLYSYRSLLLFRLLKESPLSYRESLRIMRDLMPSVVIWVIQHEDYQSPDKCCVLRRARDSEKDLLEISYKPSKEMLQRQQKHEKAMIRYMRKLGCWPLKLVRPGHGSSVHYAGQFPITREDKPLTTEPSGRLRGTQSVYLADGATLAYLPAKGPTFTLMANADRIGKQVLHSILNG